MWDVCRRCGHKLRAQQSKDVGYGRLCLWKIRRALPTGYTMEQLGKALDLINDGGIASIGIGTRRNQVFRVVSSNGQDKYLTATMMCSCPAGRAARLCYHRVAVAWIMA